MKLFIVLVSLSLGEFALARGIQAIRARVALPHKVVKQITTTQSLRQIIKDIQRSEKDLATPLVRLFDNSLGDNPLGEFLSRHRRLS